ncbi:MAG TPA: twin-arginine translocase subunit TatC [Candidatus Manganitrophaceae bacterium]|nr:twin-arginine translocase subunit TatC [Candidatus Manganitrophaceae bacterium]
MPGDKDRREMPITGHLLELRSRLVKSVLFLLLFCGVAFYFSDQLFFWFKRPLKAELIFLSPAEAFWSDLKISLFAGFMASFPVILFEIWQFVSPGLLPKERGYFLPFIVLGTLFFFVGVAFCYFVALPLALDFLIEYGRRSGIKPQISVSMYIDFNLKFLLSFGLIFELPLVMILFARMGMLTPAFLARNRKYAILLAFFIAAILTPTPDVFNQTVMAIPLIVLYEIGIIAVRIFGGTRVAVQKQETEGT